MNDFDDLRVFVIPCSSRPNFIGYSQAHDGPTYIHVGTGLTNAQLFDVWEKRERFPTITLEQLTTARDGKVDSIRVA